MNRPEETKQPGYIATLDGWRAVAIALVVAAHCHAFLINSGTQVGRALAAFVNHAGYGVDIFFALSGFLISTLLLKEKERTGDISLRRFYVRRFFRIIPPLVVYLAVVGWLTIIGRLPAIPQEFVSSILFFRNYSEGTWYTGHFWSLSIEEHFYAVAPLLILLLPPRRLVRVWLALIVACIAIRAWEFSHYSLTQFRTECRIDALLWGSAAALACRNPAFAQRLRSLLKPTVVYPLVLVGVLLLLPDWPAFRRTLCAMLLPVLVAYTVLRPADLLGKLLELAPVRFVGRLSYSLYIWQMLFLVPLQMERHLGVFQSFPLALVMAAACALASYYLVEKPMIRLGHRLTTRDVARTPALAA
jgi:peptidoglycan/LPS O-acetylase OafA/YrhL